MQVFPALIGPIVKKISSTCLQLGSTNSHGMKKISSTCLQLVPTNSHGVIPMACQRLLHLLQSETRTWHSYAEQDL